MAEIKIHWHRQVALVWHFFGACGASNKMLKKRGKEEKERKEKKKRKERIREEIRGMRN